jgi:hypothetical protein
MLDEWRLSFLTGNCIHKWVQSGGPRHTDVRGLGSFPLIEHRVNLSQRVLQNVSTYPQDARVDTVGLPFRFSYRFNMQ